MNKRLAIFSFICRSVHDNAHRNERKQTQTSFKKTNYDAMRTRPV